MTRRFYADAASLAGSQVEIDGALAHRTAKVLRMRVGDEVILFDGGGEDVRVCLDEVGDRLIRATVIERSPGPIEPRLKVHVYQSITKGDRFEWLLEKATELGVSSITPLLAARAVVKTGGDGNRAERWRRIVSEAAEQCERSTVPAIGAPRSFDAALGDAPGIVILPYEEAGDRAPNINDIMNRRVDDVFALAAVSVFIGPEGGYEAGEIERAAAAGAEIVTLGARVLRSETAGLVAATLVMQSVGELG
jgi:16S rRNA (uracil1498-N3)-methyltransferase